MVYQERIKANLLQLFVYPENPQWFYTISVVIFEVNIFAEQKQAYCNDVFVFCKFPQPSTFH